LKQTTPLSDAIAILLSDSRPGSLALFVETFRRSRVGVVVLTLPSNRLPGETFQAGPGEVSLALVSTPDGRRMVKACADPETFASRYPDTTITALMLGEAVLGVVAAASDIDGVLVCSASSFHSVPIGRSDAATGPSRPTSYSSRPWWKFWSR
jgi:hypothetical protein